MPKAEKVKVNLKERVEDNAIDLSLSELTDVPVREIATFKRVTIMDLSNNKIMTLGKTFPSLTRLIKLDLSKNQLKYLPEDFGNLRNLRHLDLYNNKLSHLPLSFGNLTNLRYLDLKDNPLTPALAKIVGLCITAKDCQMSARNTVQFLARMQDEVDKAKEKFQLENGTQIEAIDDEKKAENNKPKKAKKTKSKSKKPNNKTDGSPMSPNTNGAQLSKSNMNLNASPWGQNSSTALKTILMFFLLLTINIFVIYLIMFKNPEIAEKLVELIPHQYRNWILTKSEVFRLHVSDWIQEFRTPPEEN